MLDGETIHDGQCERRDGHDYCFCFTRADDAARVSRLKAAMAKERAQITVPCPACRSAGIAANGQDCGQCEGMGGLLVQVIEAVRFRGRE